MAWANDECPTSGGWLDGEAHLRALSLDLRGVVPEPDEVSLMDGEVPEDVIDDWLGTNAFAERAVKFHRGLLWNNITNVRAVPNQALLGVISGIWFDSTRAGARRGEALAHCGTQPATFDPDGNIIAVEQEDGLIQEGWVWVTPYWAPDTQIQVCAFDAVELERSPRGTDCSTSAAFTDVECGCGPNLQWCTPFSEHQSVMASFGEEVEERVRQNVLSDASWLDLLTGQTAYMNGRMVHFLKHHASFPGGVRFTEPMVDAETLPDLAYDDNDLVAVDLGSEHSGIFTSPAFLLRFQTGRARANQLYNNFLCQPFQPPTNGLPAVDEQRPTLDLTVRDGCKYCHALLEPAAAHWGRWSPAGAGYLDPDAFPAYSPECAQCATGLIDCSETCSRYYLTRPLAAEQDPYVGWLNAYAFLETRHEPNVELGPGLLIEQGVVDGRIPSCAAQKAAEWLLGRPVTANDQPWLDSLAADFVASGYSWRTLIKRIVMSSEYRSVQ